VLNMWLSEKSIRSLAFFYSCNLQVVPAHLEIQCTA
jgi:hypothetical protein